MDGRLTRGAVLIAIGAGLLWFGSGILQAPGDHSLAENAMIISLIAGLYIIVLALTSFYDFATRADSSGDSGY
jgi:hypothetical protein